MRPVIGRFVYDSATVEAVDAGGNVPLTTATATPLLTSDGTTVTFAQGGTYEVAFNATFSATAAGTIETQLYRNGNAIPGAHAYATAAAEGDLVPQSFTALITVPKCGQTTVNVKAIDATSVAVANLIIVKVA